jgi:hypothetical protein
VADASSTYRGSTVFVIFASNLSGCHIHTFASKRWLIDNLFVLQGNNDFRSFLCFSFLNPNRAYSVILKGALKF